VKQEAQRAVKDQTKTEISTKQADSKEPNKSAIKTIVSSGSTAGKEVKTESKKSSSTGNKVKSGKTSSKVSLIAGSKLTDKGQLFPHIPKRETDQLILTESVGYDGDQLHPDIVRIGLQMNSNRIVDSTSRCLAVLCALKSMFEHYEPSSSSGAKAIVRQLEIRMDQATEFLDRCRPLNVSLRNVLRIVRTQLSKVSNELGAEKAKQSMSAMIERFIHEEIECGLDGIKEHGSQKIHDDDVILVFNNSFLVRHILGQALSDGKQFKVIVVDTNPRREGRAMLDYLVSVGVDTTYILINAVAHVMKGVRFGVQAFHLDHHHDHNYNCLLHLSI
jgi:translation initiation factor eIF-2B subunit delta